MTEWRDISTAPKDGTIIKFQGHYGERGPKLFWEQAHWSPNRGWIVRGNGDHWFPIYGSGTLPFKATGWQPLPEPPPMEAGYAQLQQARAG